MKRISLLLCAALLLAGCSDDDCPSCPGSQDPPEPTLDNIWPHADGTRWTYDLRYAVHDGPEPSEDVPPLPTMEELHAALQQPVDTPQQTLDSGLYRLEFDGEITSETGVTGQDLVESVYAPVGGERSMRWEPARYEERFLQLVARFRPDLREAIGGGAGEVPTAPDKELDEMGTLYFLGAYVFAAEDTGYYGYGDVSTGHAWSYLEGDLTPGSSWSLELLGGGSDLWLHGQIWSVGEQEIGGQVHPEAVTVLYVVDLGVQQEADDEGNLIGMTRSYMSGITVFAPGVGPVACTERHVFAGGGPLGGPSLITESRCILVGR